MIMTLLKKLVLTNFRASSRGNT